MRSAALALSLSLLAAAGASAQDAHRADVFGGYSMLRTGSDTFQGWQASLGWGLSGRVGLLLDASGHQGTAENGDDASVLSLMAGPRLTFSSGRARPFVHALAGVVRSKAGIEVLDVEITESRTDFGGAAGGGIDLGFGDRWAARVAADYRVLRVEAETEGDPRLSAGVVYRFGAR